MSHKKGGGGGGGEGVSVRDEEKSGRISRTSGWDILCPGSVTVAFHWPVSSRRINTIALECVLCVAPDQGPFELPQRGLCILQSLRWHSLEQYRAERHRVHKALAGIVHPAHSHPGTWEL